MITNRRTVQVKQGRMDEYAAMVRMEAQHANLPHGYRLYTSDIGTSNILALEMDFDDVEHYARWWRAWKPFDPKFAEMYPVLVEHDIANEVWNQVE